jgi:hypothetical protein
MCAIIHGLILFYLFSVAILGIEPRAWYMLGKFSIRKIFLIYEMKSNIKIKSQDTEKKNPKLVVPSAFSTWW